VTDLSCYVYLWYIHLFPTRRSSDLQQVNRSPSIEIDIRSHQHVAELAVVGGSDLNFKIWSLGTLHFYPESKLAIFLVLTAYRGICDDKIQVCLVFGHAPYAFASLDGDL